MRLKEPAQPCTSTLCRLHHTCCTLQRLHFTLQWPMAYPSHTGTALCAVVAEKNLHLQKYLLESSKAACPTNHLPSPALAPGGVSSTCCTLQRLHLTLQWPMACSGLATHKLARICEPWLPNAASSTGNLHKPAKPQPPQTTCPALPQPPVQSRPHLMHTIDAEFDLAVAHSICRAGHSHTNGVMCAVVAECCLLLEKSP